MNWWVFFVAGFGFRVLGFGFRVPFDRLRAGRVRCSGARSLSLPKCRVSGSGFRVCLSACLPTPSGSP